MQAGFCRLDITPPMGTRMIGYTSRDAEGGCTGVHDPLFVRALSLRHDEVELLVLAMDLCFLDRGQADRLRGALGRRTGLPPAAIMVNFSHTHAGPATHRWGVGDYTPPDRLYLQQLIDTVLEAAEVARASRRPVTLEVGLGKTTLPLNRRRRRRDGGIDFAPNPDGPVHDTLPVMLLRDPSNRPVCLLYSASCHASSVGGYDISADFPGETCRLLDEYLGAPVSMFLQGTAGDTKARVLDYGDGRWHSGFAAVKAAGRLLAGEVMSIVKGKMLEVEPALSAAEFELCFKLDPLPTVDQLRMQLEDTADLEVKRQWAGRQLELIQRGRPPVAEALVTLHGVQLAAGCRMVGIEAEAVAEVGQLVERVFDRGVSFSLGYTDGTQLYLPVDHMLEEGGYEVDSFYEYGFPSRLARGIDATLVHGLDRLKAQLGE